MRIIAGDYSGRPLKTLKGNATRPTLDKVKEAVFSSLGGFFDGGAILDLYSGSGAIGLEALSRGMDKAYLVDKSREAVEIIKENVNTLKANDYATVLCMKDTIALKTLKDKNVQFDLVYLDPPYALQQNEKIISFLDSEGMLKENARIVVECLKEDEHSERIGNIHKYKDAVYGITRIVYYRKESI